MALCQKDGSDTSPTWEKCPGQRAGRTQAREDEDTPERAGPEARAGWVLRGGFREEVAGSGRRERLQTAGTRGSGMKDTPPASSQNPLFPQESVNRLHAQMQAFVSESQRAAELEEKRRYRFLAEKHLLLSNTFLQFFGRVSWGWGTAT